MKVATGIVLAGLAALAAGGLEAAAEGFVRETEPAKGPSSVTVPIGRIGDRAAYARFERTAPALEWTRDAETSPGRGDRTYHVRGIGQQADVTGLRRNVLLISNNFTDRYTDGLPGERNHESHEVSTEAVDLSTRHVVASRADIQANGTAFFVRSDTEKSGTIFYALGPHRADFGGDTLAKHPLVIHQGRTYRLGEAKPEVAAELLLAEAARIRDVWNGVGLQVLSSVARVEQEGAVGDQRALAILVEGCVRPYVLDANNAWWWGDEEEVQFLGFMVPVPSNVCFEVRQWLNGDTPYPLLIEARIRVNETMVHESRTGLAAFRAGTDTIPWSADPVAPRAMDPGMERSPAAQRFPADGVGTLITFPLSAALAAVDGDLALTQFTAWKLQNPGAQLLGAKMGPTGPEGRGRLWTLTYGVPGRTAFIVQTEQAVPGGATVQTQVGERPLNGRAPQAPPLAPITFAALEARWREVFPSPANLLVPDSAGWGLRFAAGGIYCPTTTSCRPLADFFYSGIDDNDFHLSRSDGGVHTGGRIFQVIGPECCSPFMLYANAASGNLVYQREFHREIRLDPLAVPAAYSAPEPIKGNSAPGAAPGSWDRAALTSSSAFLLFVVGYFLPILKFLTTRVGIALPGYAKLRKEALLDNKVREQIVQAVRAEPGITPPELQRLTGAGWSTVVYHLSLLEKNKLVSSLIDGRHKRFFPAEEVAWNERGRIAALKNLRTRQLYELITNEPGVGPSDLAHRVSLSRQAIYGHVERLERAGLVGRDRVRFRTAFYANPEGAAIMDPASSVEIA